MTVRVRTKQSGVQPPTSFSDTFNRTSGNVGNNWDRQVYLTTPHPDPDCLGEYVIGAGGVGQVLIVQSFGNNNPLTNYPTAIFTRVTRNGTFGKTPQFVQATFLQEAGNNHLGGLAVMVNDDAQTMYGLWIDGGAGPNNLSVQRIIGGANTDITGVAPVAVVNNDVLRMSATVNAGNVTIIISRNGTVIYNVVDSNAARITTGFTGGFYWLRMPITGGVGQQTQWRNFSCGLGI